MSSIPRKYLNIFPFYIQLILAILNPETSFINDKMTREMFKPGEKILFVFK